jgi:hypothetical protein
LRDARRVREGQGIAIGQWQLAADDELAAFMHPKDLAVRLEPHCLLQLASDGPAQVTAQG